MVETLESIQANELLDNKYLLLNVKTVRYS